MQCSTRRRVRWSRIVVASLGFDEETGDAQGSFAQRQIFCCFFPS
jgi:hypothetical protein